MIPFYRKIRKKLSDDNKPMKYARYAIGEIALVVIGILIALSINNWNDERLREQDLKIYMNNLVEDLNSDINSLTIWGYINQFRYNSLQHLLVLSGQNPTKFGYSLIVPKFEEFNFWEGSFPKEFDPDFIKITFQNSVLFGNIKPSLSTMEELRSNGLFSYIRNSQLKTSINNYYTEFGRRLGALEDENARKYRDDWLDSLTQNGYNQEDIIDLRGSLEWLGENRQATARLKSIIYNAKWRYESTDVLIKEAKELIDLIHKNEFSNSK